MGEITCPLCGYVYSYKYLSLPAGDKKYYRCRGCGKMPFWSR